ncbi:MAG: hypothetical protein ACFB20_01075 [Opitutales bacterium]
MPFAKENPIFTAILALCALVFLGGVALAVLAWMDAGDAQDRLDSARNQTRAARQVEMAPTDANIEKAQANIDLLKRKEAQLLEAVASAGNIEQAPSDLRGANLRGNLLRLPTRMRQLAAETAAANVDIEFEENLRFGFDRYFDEAWPPSGITIGTPEERQLIEDLFLQQSVIEYLTKTLFESAPESWPPGEDMIDPDAEIEPFPLRLTAVKRENALPHTIRSTRDIPGVFEIEPAISAETELIDTIAFQVEFESYSKTLREFLRQLGSYEIPIVVRSVEVAPVETSRRRTANVDFGDEFFDSSNEPEVEEVLEPVIEIVESRFTVTLEYIQLKERPEAPAGDEAAALAAVAQ